MNLLKKSGITLGGLVMTASFTTHLGVLYKLAACVTDGLLQAGMLRRQITPTGLVLFDN